MVAPHSRPTSNDAYSASQPPDSAQASASAEGAEGDESSESTSESHARTRHHRGGLRHLVTAVFRLADTQYRIWLTQAKITALRVALFAALFVAALLLGVLGIIFLFIGAFHLLTDVAGLAPVWAYLIFAGVQLLLAIGLIAGGTSMLSEKDHDKDGDKGGDKGLDMAADSRRKRAGVGGIDEERR